MFIPVRHHSPACARTVRDSIRSLRPAIILIEGPSDFNDRLSELFLDHKLPIAIYSYVVWKDQSRAGAYYPFCDFSPEWQALVTARECGAQIRFIDLPFASMAQLDKLSHLYADGRMRSGEYQKGLLKALNIDNFDDAWDFMFEQNISLSAESVRSQVGDYCANLRALDMRDEAIDERDLQRERFMAAHIRKAIAEFGEDRVLVVTGGYHTSGLKELLRNNQTDFDTDAMMPPDMSNRGIALTPYSFQRLDSLVGYNAGMPSPGFYQQVWESLNSREEVHGPLLKKIINKLREIKQIASTADLIGVEMFAKALALLRGHTQIWRRDLLDSIISVLLKDDFTPSHPFLLVTQEVLRGGAQGSLDARSPLPPLVVDIQQRLKAADLFPESKPKEVNLSLLKSIDLEKSRLLHGLLALAIPGFLLEEGVDFLKRDDLSHLSEEWSILQKENQAATLIESSRYGSDLPSALANRLNEQAHGIERSSAEAARLLLTSVQCGILSMALDLRSRIVAIIHQDGDLTSVATALSHLLYLFSWDDVFQTRGALPVGDLLKEAYNRAMWLLELGTPTSSAAGDVLAIQVIRDAFERAEVLMKLDRKEFAETLARVQADSARSPAQRGACAGAQWSLNCADPASIHRDLLLFSSPDKMGDFLTGLFALAREQCQGDVNLLQSIHTTVKAWDDDGFLTALPSLRLAFMYFTSREKSSIGRILFPASKENPNEAALPTLAVSIGAAANAMAFEKSLFDLAKIYGIVLTE